MNATTRARVKELKKNIDNLTHLKAELERENMPTPRIQAILNLQTKELAAIEKL